MKILDWIKAKLPKRQPPSVYFSVFLDAPFLGCSEKEPEKPWIKVTGLTLEAAGKITGIDWNTTPHLYRRPLEQEPYCLEIEWGELKRWVE